MRGEVHGKRMHAARARARRGLGMSFVACDMPFGRRGRQPLPDRPWDVQRLVTMPPVLQKDRLPLLNLEKSLL
jgi:hypothetical protein